MNQNCLLRSKLVRFKKDYWIALKTLICTISSIRIPFPNISWKKLPYQRTEMIFWGGKVHQLCSKFIFFSFKSNWYITMCRSSILIVVVVKVISIMYTYKSVKSLINLNSIVHYFLWTCSAKKLENVTFIVQIVIVYTSPSDNVKKMDLQF